MASAKPGSAVRDRLRRGRSELLELVAGADELAGEEGLGGRLAPRRAPFRRSLSPPPSGSRSGLHTTRIARDFGIVRQTFEEKENRPVGPNRPSEELTAWKEASRARARRAGPEDRSEVSSLASTADTGTESVFSQYTLDSILSQGEGDGGGLRRPLSARQGGRLIGQRAGPPKDRVGVVSEEFLCVGLGVMGLLFLMYAVQYAARNGYIYPPDPVAFPGGPGSGGGGL